MLSIETIGLLVKLVPTALFLLIVLVYTISNCLMGKRKSLIFLFHSLIVGFICVILFITLVNVEEIDEFLLKVADFFCGGEKRFQQLLNLSADIDYKSLKEVFVDFIPNIVSDNTLSIILADNGAYLKALVNLAYHIVFALLLLIIYDLFKLILFIFYLIFYSDSKYKKKREKEFYNGENKVSYKKGRLAGTFIGLGRGLVVGLLTLSFLGSNLYMITGDSGNKPMDSYRIDNETYDYGYQVYQEICQYGNYGIFAFLNLIKDSNDVPYYLLASDFIFRGYYSEVIDDEKVEYSINLREELSTVTSFSKQTANLLLKYGGDEIRPILSGKDNSSDIKQVVLDIFALPDFQKDFKIVINNIDSGNFVIEMGLSFVDSFIDNIDFIFNGSDNTVYVDLIKVLFKDNYYSKNIEVENAMILLGETDTDLPHLSLKKLFTKDDVSTLVSIIFEFLSVYKNETFSLFTMMKNILPYLANLSILNSSRKGEMNPVFNRLFTYLSDYYISNALKQYSTLEERQYTKEELKEAIKYKKFYDIENKDISWGNEIKTLISSMDNISYFYKCLMNKSSENSSIPNVLENLLAYFQEDQEDYSKNIKVFDSLKSIMRDTKLLGCVLDNRYVVDYIQSSLKSSLGSDFIIPEGVTFESTYENGKFVSGELYNFFSAVEFLGKKDNANVLNALMSGGFSDLSELSTMIENLKEIDSSGTKYMDYFLDSKIITSIVSCSLSNFSKSSGVLYISDFTLEKNSKGECINVIQRNELELLFNNIDSIIYLNDILVNSGDALSVIDTMMENEEFKNFILQSKIAQGSIGLNFYNYLSDNSTIVIPNSLSNPELWISTKNNAGELESLLSLYEIEGFSLYSIVNSNELYYMFCNLSADDVNKILDSKIIRYSLSNYLINSNVDMSGITMVIPNASLVVLKNDVIPYLINKDEIVKLVSLIANIPSSDDMNTLIKHVLDNKDKYLASQIFGASFVCSFTNYIDNKYLPSSLIQDGQIDSLKGSYGTGNNLWDKELVNFMNSIVEIFGEDEINFDNIESKSRDILNRWDEPSRTNSRVPVMEMVSNSIIIRSLVTEAICSTDLSSFLEDEIISASKDRFNTFSSTELVSICSLLDIIGIDIDSAESIGNINFISVALKFPSYKDEMERDISSSVLVRGIITKGLLSIDSLPIKIVAHPLAYDNNNCTFTSLEIISLFNVLVSMNGDLNFTSICSNNTLLKAIYDESTGETGSYILSATISNTIKSMSEIIIPITALDSYNYILSEQVYYFIMAIRRLGFSNLSFNSVEVGEKIKTLDESSCDQIVKSKIINSTIVYFIYLGNGNEISIASDHASIVDNVSDINVRAFDVDSMEIKLLLLNFGDFIDENFNINIDYESFKNFYSSTDDIEYLLTECSIIRIIIQNMLDNTLGTLSILSKSESLKTYCFKDGNISAVIVELYSISQMQSIFGMF